MPIKNTDGTIFQLKKPNPLLKTQDMPGDEHIVHNFSVQEVLVRYTKKKKPVAPNGAVVSTPTLPPALEEQPVAPTPAADLKPMPPPKVVEHEARFETPQPVPPEPDEEDDYMEEDDAAAQDVVSCWCLPGEYRQHIDNLYGETRRNLVWGEKFMLEAVILQSTEMNFVIWAQVKIGPPSIIYVRSHRRWWRVTGVEPHDNGYAMSCLPSETRPSFD